MLNRVQIIGRLGQDPVLRYSQSGAAVCNFSVATDESFTDRDGNRQERTEWHRVVLFNKQAESCSKFLNKGSLVYVEGSLISRKYQDQQGIERTVWEIRGSRALFLDRKTAQEYDGYEYASNNDGNYDRTQGHQIPRNAQSGGNVNYSSGRNQRSANPANRQTAPQDDEFDPVYPSEVETMNDSPYIDPVPNTNKQARSSSNKQAKKSAKEPEEDSPKDVAFIGDEDLPF